MAQLVKNPPATWETWVRSLGWEDPLEEGNGYPLQYSGLENSVDCIAHGRIAEWDTTEDFHFPFFSVVLEFSGLSLSSSCPPHFPVLQFLLLPACVGIYGKHLGRAVA